MTGSDGVKTGKQSESYPPDQPILHMDREGGGKEVYAFDAPLT